MSGLKIFEKDEYGKVREIEKSKSSDFIGFFYVLEWGGNIKIGCTRNPYQRIMAFKRQAEKYGDTTIGRYVLSNPHTNYQENEKLLHKAFASARIVGTELFSLSLDMVIQNIPKEIQIKDESEALACKAEQFCDFMKTVVTGVRG